MLSERISGEEPLHQDFEALSVSKRLVRSVSQKLRKKTPRGEEEEDNDLRGVSFKCLTMYSRGGACKVGTDTGEEYGNPSSRRRSSASEEGKGYEAICGTEETGVACFSYAMEFWKRNNRKYLELEESVRNSRMHIFLPDDILEMCLVRLPLTSLMTARLVCKKWRYLTTTSRFLQIRREGSYRNPWLFLFGTVKNGYCSGEIHALDVSQDQRHKIDADILKGRFMFSVTSIQDDIYIVGGCSSLTSFGRLDRSTCKTHKGVLVFSPLNKSWRKVASMKYARSMSILGMSEVSSNCSVVQSHQYRQDRRFYRSRIGGVSDVYEDPHRLSLRRQCRSVSEDYEASFLASRKSHKFTRQKHDQSSTKGCKKFVLIAVGGLGSWDEPLDSAEIYDSISNKWTEIQRLPIDFGIVCAGVICNGMFYVYSETDKLMSYDIDRGYWIGIQTSPFPPRIHEYYPKLVSCNGRLFMLSVSWCEGDGQIGRRNKAVRKLWELDLMYLTWTEVSVHPDAPMDWNAVFVADRDMIFGVEIFKIFGQVLDFLTMCNVSDMGTNWSHISRNQMALELDASSCMTKSMVVLHL
ncbi:F-box/kelch-repeat protein [Tripterygium wilfordii]|uniref:F-box/kelch-repeat protein n=1 Tax=Tripterygium wilfordii TaxID=458696 RepID=A0A7J7DLK4_TRIWF|nr:F-box/kelch-repeat protein At5g42350-like [Tripterygium wilfordii]XP_038704296.1 F-box/kelch-repeat protein At5g42350-like [Tripterygium wilfordii]KAF5747245.1 F-box/kelch-repeat protein [Tripterygium wilfordii]